MPFNRFLLLIAVFAGLLAYISCRKMDRVAQQDMNTEEHKFFNEHRSADPTEKVLVAFIKRKNDSLHLVQKTVDQIGYPRWDKGMIISGQVLPGRTATDSSFSFISRLSRNHTLATTFEC